MTTQSTTARPGYDTLSQVFHWMSAALIILALLPLGFYAHWLGDGPVRAGILDHWHKPLGLLIIAITVFRLGWKALRPAVREARGLTPLEAIASRTAHRLLYLLLLAMPLSGLLMSQGAGRPTSFFGLFSIPQMLALNPALKPREQYYYKLGVFLHETLFCWALVAVLVIHICGALKHRYVDGDRGYFRRMLGRTTDTVV
jgi:cytochrome b561